MNDWIGKDWSRPPSVHRGTFLGAAHQALFSRKECFSEACNLFPHQTSALESPQQPTVTFTNITLHFTSSLRFPSRSFSFREVQNRSHLRPRTQTGNALISATITQTCILPIIAAFLVHVCAIPWNVGCRGEHLVTIQRYRSWQHNCQQQTIYCVLCYVTQRPFLCPPPPFGLQGACLHRWLPNCTFLTGDKEASTCRVRLVGQLCLLLIRH